MKTLLLSLLLVASSCGKNSSSSSNENSTSRTQENPNHLKEIFLLTPDGQEIQAAAAYKPEDQENGLSGVKPETFSYSMGKFFIYFKDASRVFWMPNTYFALDIIYLDKNLVINEIVWALPAYSGNVNSEIPRAPAVKSRHVLEMKAGSPISGSLRIGDQLKWNSSVPMEETLKRMQDELSEE